MKIRKLTALLLTLCMIFSLSVAAFAAEPEMFGPDDLHRPPFGQTGPDAVGAGYGFRGDLAGKHVGPVALTPQGVQYEP